MTIIKGDFAGPRPRARAKNKKKEKQPAPLYQFHVSLCFSEPVIWRRILVPGEVTLRQMHMILQICFAWTGECNHQFYVGKVFYNVGPAARKKDQYNEADYNLQSLEEAMRWCFTYIYDAGDGWEHEIVLEDVLAPRPDRKMVELIDGEWAAPPESIGSVHLYADLLYALENPEQEQSKRLLQGYDIDGFDPYLFDRDDVNAKLKKIVWQNLTSG